MKAFLSLFLAIFIVGCSKLPLNTFPSKQNSSNNSIIIESSEPVVVGQSEVVSVEPIIIEEEEVSNVNERVPQNQQINQQQQEPKKRVAVVAERKKRRKPPTKEQIELRKIMRKFDYLIFNKINMDMLQGEEDMFFGKNIYPLLKDFVKDSKKIATLYPDADEQYKKIANSLYKKAKVLEHIIKKRKTKYFKLQLNSIIDTCNLCHSIYNN